MSIDIAPNEGASDLAPGATNTYTFTVPAGNYSLATLGIGGYSNDDSHHYLPYSTQTSVNPGQPNIGDAVTITLSGYSGPVPTTFTISTAYSTAIVIYDATFLQSLIGGGTVTLKVTNPTNQAYSPVMYPSCNADLSLTLGCSLTASVVMNAVSATTPNAAYAGGATGQAHGAYVAPLTFVWNITNNQTQQPVKTGQQDNQGLGGSQVEWSDTVGTVANPTTVTANLTITDSASPPCVATASGQYTTQPAPGSGGGSGGSGGGSGGSGGGGGTGGGSGGSGGGTPGNPGGGAGGGGGGSGASVTGNPADPNAPGIGRGGQGLGIVSPDSTGTNIFSALPTPTTELCAEPLT